VKFDALRRLSSGLTLAACAVMSSVILGSCGGGGASASNTSNGDLSVLPAAASLYAGVPYTFTIAGGRNPYVLSSSEPVLLPVPATVSGHTFQVIPNNPGVIDASLPPGALPIRSVVLTVRDATGLVISTASTNGLTVGQNFLVGYGVIVNSTCATGQACAGSDAVVTMQSVTNGSLYGDRGVRFCVVRGEFQFITPFVQSSVPDTLVNCVDTTSDHAGVARARLRVASSAGAQIATLRVQDIATGAYVDQLFTISAAAPPTGAITILPNDITFTGPRVGICGTGSSDFLVFDGTPPYTAVSSNPNVGVSPSTSSTNPARFTVSALSSTVCVDHATIVVFDAQQRRATVTVTSAEGTVTPPALVVSPTTVTLNDTCGFSTAVTAVGGAGPLGATSTHPRVTAVVSGSTVSITRALHDPAPPPAFYPITATVSITDGTTIQNVTVNAVNTFCP
jgi:hypothetical protein